jgi:hypothetical protein
MIVGAGSASTVVPGSYDVGGPDQLTFAAMTTQIAELQGRTPRSFDLPFSNSRLEGAVADLVVGNNALHTVFGLEPTPFAEAAAHALEAA